MDNTSTLSELKKKLTLENIHDEAHYVCNLAISIELIAESTRPETLKELLAELCEKTEELRGALWHKINFDNGVYDDTNS